MTKIMNAFLLFLKQIWNDIMLTAILIVPIFIGLVFRFGVPQLEVFLCKEFESTAILSPYYLLFDLTIVLATPIMFAYSGVMVVLEEFDTGIAKYLSVTPLGKFGYIISRIGIMSFIACVYSFIIVEIFKISDISVGNLLMSEVISFLLGIMISFAVIGIAHNKVEGLALSKFSGILLLGFFAPLFLNGYIRYIAAFLPTYWVMEFCYHEKISGLIISLILSLLYIVLFYRKFEKKLSV